MNEPIPASALTPAGPRPALPERRHSADEYVSWNLMLGMVRRRWPIILAMLALCVGAAALYLKLASPTYESGTSLLVEKDEYNLPELVKRLTNENELSTQVEVLRSTDLAERVVKDLGLQVNLVAPRGVARSALLDSVVVDASADTGTVVLERVAGNRFRATQLATGRKVESVPLGQVVSIGALSFRLKPAAASQQTIELAVGTAAGAVDQLQQELKVVRPDRNGNVIWVSYRSRDPLLAAQVPNLLAAHYIASRVERARDKVRTAVTFLRGESDTLHSQLLAAEQDLQKYRQREGIVSLPDEATSEVTEASDLRTTRAKFEAERAALERLVAEADTGNTKGPSPYRRLTAFPTLVGNPVVSNLLLTLNTLENQRAELLLRRTPDDPDAQASQRRIAEVDGQLRGLTLTYLAGLGNQVSALDRALRAHDAVAARIPRKNMEDERLSRRPKLLADVYALVQTRLQEARIAEGAADPGVAVIDRASPPPFPVWPRRGLILAVAVAAGLIGGGALAWMREGMDGAVHSRADVVRAADVRVLGVVPHIRAVRPALRNGRPSFVWNSPEPPSQSEMSALEAYTWLGTSLALARPDEAIRTITFTSPLAKEGKTTNATNFALSAGRRGRSVLLVDADLRRGRIHEVFNIRRSPGLAEVLAKDLDPDSAILRVTAGRGRTVDVMPSGECVEHPSALLGSPAFARLLESLRERYDLVVSDSPPVNLVSDALLIGRLMDSVVLVARAGITDVAALTEASRHLRDAGAPLLGVLLNDIDLRRDGGYDEAYRYLEKAGEYAAAAQA